MWNRCVVVVAGKGGVGRSTLALAVAQGAAADGREVALVEVHGARSLANAYGVGARGPRPARVAPGIDLFSLDASACLEAYTADRRAMAPLAGAVFGSRLVRGFIDALPGMGDLLHLGLIHSLLAQGMGDRPPYDTVVLDAPPTGHGVAFTNTARSMLQMTRSGPIHDESLLIADLLDDPDRTAQIVVTLPEPLPVGESLELLGALGPQEATVAAVVVNRFEPDPFDRVLPWPRVRDGLATLPDGLALCAVGDRLERRLVQQREALSRLRAGIGDRPLVTVPRLPEPPGPANLRPVIDALRRGATP